MRLLITYAVLIIVCSVLCLPRKAASERVQPSEVNTGLPERPIETETNFEGIDLNDTTEDPAYAQAGEELARGAATGVIGKAAPLAEMKTIDGETINLADIYGKKPVYIKFWATWCTPCRQQMPGFQRIYETLGEKMQVIAVNVGFSDDISSVRAFRDIFGLTMPIVIDDGRLMKLFHVNVTPQHILIGKDVRFTYIGHAENTELENAIQHVVMEHDHGESATAVLIETDQVVRPGDLVPDVSVKLLNGESVPLKARPGRLLAVQFFSSWCEWYLETSRPDTSKACARARESIENISVNNQSVDWIGISGGPWVTEQDLLDYKKNYNVSIPLGLDSSNNLFRAFGIHDIPTIALINDSGRLIRLIGPKDGDLPFIVRAVTDEMNAAGHPSPTE